MSHHEINLEPHKLLSAVFENLNQQFFADSRAAAKILYNNIAGGEQAPFMRIAFGDSGEVICNLGLDASLYSGKLNFGKFRKCLAMMLKGISIKLDKHVKTGESLNIMNSDDGQFMFNIPGIVKSTEGINVLVCGMHQQGPGAATIGLMFLDPMQYPILEQLIHDDTVNPE